PGPNLIPKPRRLCFSITTVDQPFSPSMAKNLPSPPPLATFGYLPRISSAIRTSGNQFRKALRPHGRPISPYALQRFPGSSAPKLLGDFPALPRLHTAYSRLHTAYS